MPEELPKVAPHTQMRGAPRDTFRKQVVAQYRSGASIREIGRATDRSYGAIHHLIEESGVPFRPRGGKR